MSLATVAEVLEGAADPQAVERELRELAHVVSIGAETARRCALVQRRGKSVGRRMGENDAWIASAAQLSDLTLVGRDDDAFKDRPGLRYVRFD